MMILQQPQIYPHSCFPFSVSNTNLICSAIVSTCSCYCIGVFLSDCYSQIQPISTDVELLTRLLPSVWQHFPFTLILVHISSISSLLVLNFVSWSQYFLLSLLFLHSAFYISEMSCPCILQCNKLMLCAWSRRWGLSSAALPGFSIFSATAESS